MMTVLRHPCLIMSANCSENTSPGITSSLWRGRRWVRGKWVRKYVDVGEVGEGEGGEGGEGCDERGCE